ncbi:unnamed protein product, partial [Adineta steineri]
YNGTKEISQGAKYTVTRDGDKCILIINNATPDDVDEYSIKARNQRGSRMYYCNVNVRSPPKYQDVLNYDKGESFVIKFLILNVQVDSVFDESVELSWCPPEDDGDSYITN